MPDTWKELPEINRRVAFTFNVQSLSAHLGCHCGTITGVVATFGGGYSAGNNGRNIEVMDTSIEPQFRFTKNKYTGNSEPPAQEIAKVLKYLRNKKFDFQDIVENGYDALAQKCSNYPLWVMSDAINYGAPAKAPPPMFTEKDDFCSYGRTADFAKYLINNKIGYVMASPIIQNPTHRVMGNYSLNQGWFWIPPKHIERAIDVAEVHGETLFPSQEDWIKRVGGDIAISRGEINGNPIIMVPRDEEVLKAVFNTGVFPTVEKRFTRKRSANGRFLAAPNINEA